MSNARLREALNAGGAGASKEKGPPVADGILSVTPDTPEAAEWRTRQSAIDFPSSSSSFLEEEEDAKPADLFGKFTWKIENFSEISKRELRSNVFEVGNYKWYILVYPQGCDVCNHLSLFLCVADYDKLLPGWSHFAQFTIAVVNKDPKKSKYSDTLHRFCKKEHDWGWKKFMELTKVLDGFTVADTLVIKAQVQVIKDRISRPFRCLDPQYRRELVRVYLTNVEGICRRLVEDCRKRLMILQELADEFQVFWEELKPRKRTALIQEKGDMILKGLVKRVFNEKEVTSTLVMDAIYSGCRAIEEHSKQWMDKTDKGTGAEGMEPPCVMILAEHGVFTVGDNVLQILSRAATESIPPFQDDKSPDGLGGRSQGDEDYGKDSVDRDERRLADLGRRSVEMYVLSHIFVKNLEVAYREAESLKRQEALIREEEELERSEAERNQARQAAEKERKNRKKERKAKRKEKKELEEAERRRQEEEARAAEEEKARLAAEKRRAAEEATAREHAAKQRSQKSSARAQKERLQAGSLSPKKAATENQSASDKGSTPGPASLDGWEDESGNKAALRTESQASSMESAPQEEPATQRRDSAAQPLEPGLKKQPAANGKPLPADRGLDATESAVTSSSHSLEEEVVMLREQLKWMEAQLEERDAEICALRMQIAEMHDSSQDLRDSALSDAGARMPPRRPMKDSQQAAPHPSVDSQVARPPRENGVPPGRAVQGPTSRALLSAAPGSVSTGDSGVSEQGKAVPRGSGKRAPERATSGKYADIAAASAAAAAALHSRPGAGPGVSGQGMAMAQQSEGARVQGPSSAAPGSGVFVTGRHHRSAPAGGVPSAKSPGAPGKPGASGYPKVPTSSGYGPISHPMNGVVGMPPAHSGGGAPASSSALINGVPSYRNAALGHMADVPVASMGIPPPPPPPSTLPSVSSLQQSPSGKEGHRPPSENGDMQYPGLMMRSASGISHFTSPVSKMPPMPPSTESPSLEEFAHIGLINELLREPEH